ncbi:hypothetical protein CRENBAI_001584 [Crenichthys baileyi]|uniref:Uncharacterized protein n=1 Tax=Crenichthys baileyi TaxID=28760 RepID=A0AAV9R896_9TELE
MSVSFRSSSRACTKFRRGQEPSVQNQGGRQLQRRHGDRTGHEGEDEDLETVEADRDVETLAASDGEDKEASRDVETLSAGYGEDKEASRDIETVEAGVSGNLLVGQETCGD